WRSVVEVLQVLNAEFDLGVVDEILDELGIEATPRQLVAELETLLVVRHASTNSWRLEMNKSEFAPVYLAEDRLSAVLCRLAGYYRAKVSRTDRLPRDLSLDECTNLLAACRLLQLANRELGERRRLRRAFAQPLERYGAFKQLALVCQYELQNGESDGG